MSVALGPHRRGRVKMRPCPIRGCTEQIEHWQHACGWHWEMLPPEIQADLQSAHSRLLRVCERAQRHIDAVQRERKAAAS